jgi:hypothetical protein
MANPLQWNIVSIQAGPYHPTNGPVLNTTNSAGIIPLPLDGNPLLQIWTPGTAATVIDPAVTGDGSTFPVTIKLPATPNPIWRLPLTITALLTGSPVGWTGNRALMYGSLTNPLDHTDVAVIESDPFTVNASAAPQPVVLTGFRLTTGRPFLNPINEDYEFWIPFRASGDWHWTLRDAGARGTCFFAFHLKPCALRSSIIDTRMP